MSATRNLGRYLGILVLHGRTTVDKFEYIIERIDHKLSGWKCSSLSLAGRVTLAVSVLNALPAYAMQTSQQGSRKTHLVSWEHICRPKDQGGLGLRSAREMNQAFILKVAWGLLKRPGELWARVLLSKYLSQSPNGLVPRTTKRFSNLWKGIRLYWDTLSQGLQWSIRSGKQTSFWKERWLDSGIILENHVLDDHSPNRSAVVADFVSQSGEWDVARLRACLPENFVRQVVGLPVPSEDLGEDSPIWGLEMNGKFSVKSCYSMIVELQNVDNQPNIWKKVWNWPGPNRIKHFLWLVSHKRILTNAERFQRHMGNSGLCPCCSNEEESILHTLRDCCRAKDVWNRLIPRRDQAAFFSSDFDEWWRRSLENSNSCVMFGVAAWIIWKRRNELLFSGATHTVEAAISHHQFWINLIRESLSDDRHICNLGAQPLIEKRIAWDPPPDPWLTLNVDGSVLRQSNSAAAGGALRTVEGTVLFAFAANLGSCTITRAELRSVVKGLNLAWNSGYRRVAVQVDSLCAVQLLSNPADSDHQHASIIAQFLELKQRDWTIDLQHIYREANFLADFLANKGHSLPFGTHVISSDDPGIATWSAYDIERSSRVRLVRVTV
ncbi:Putative ribonuclease H protein At1g65750 [Linum perenne]